MSNPQQPYGPAGQHQPGAVGHQGGPVGHQRPGPVGHHQSGPYPYPHAGGPQPGQPPQPGWGQYPPPHGWEPQPPPVRSGLNPVDLIKRVTGWGEMTITDRERTRLEAAGVRENRLQQLLVWRRSVLILVAPFLLVTVGLALFNQISMLDSSAPIDEYVTDFGRFLGWLNLFSLLLLPIGVVTAIIRWADLRWSVRVLFWCWLAATLVTLLQVALPIPWQLDLEGAVAAQIDELSIEDQLALLGPEAAQAYSELFETIFGELVIFTYMLLVAVYLLPTVVGLAAGALRGARRTKTLFPAAGLPGWFVVMVAPFYSIVILAFFSVISPVLGSGLLTLGVVLVALAPLVYVAFMRRYTAPMTQSQARDAFKATSPIALAISLIGAMIIVIWLFTGTARDRTILGSGDANAAGESWFSYSQIFEAALQGFVRFLITAVVLTFLFVTVVYRDWQKTNAMGESARREHDAEIQSFRHFDGMMTGIHHQPPPPPGMR